jgi:hypothetical protein
MEELQLLFSMHINIIQKHLVSHNFVLPKLKPLIFALDVLAILFTFYLGMFV